jgi:hypothetical protein
MAMLPLMRSACAVSVGLALSGAALVGPVPVAGATGPTTRFGIAADDPGAPLPPPDPAPEAKAPVDQAPANFGDTTIRHRRHHGDPVIGR